jgi:3'-phosphoadenosine 5'-phosphosulfate (PAPS) 3'-phosphatase
MGLRKRGSMPHKREMDSLPTILETVQQTARIAGNMLLTYQQQKLEVQLKSRANFVTQADTDVEAFILQMHCER